MAQTMVNVRVAAGFEWKTHDPLTQELARVEAELGGHGRVLVRPSGTEPVLRIMVEAADAAMARALAERLAATTH